MAYIFCKIKNGKKSGRGKYTNLKILGIKEAFLVK